MARVVLAASTSTASGYPCSWSPPTTTVRRVRPATSPEPAAPAKQYSCPNEQQKYIHDFGSILNFIEYAFGKGGSSIGEIDQYHYHYADYWAPDGPIVCGTGCQYPYSLGDFFVDFTKNPTPTPFTPISLPPVLQQYTAEWFEDFGTHQGDPAPSDPDDDAIEQ